MASGSSPPHSPSTSIAPIDTELSRNALSLSPQQSPSTAGGQSLPPFDHDKPSLSPGFRLSNDDFAASNSESSLDAEGSVDLDGEVDFRVVDAGTPSDNSPRDRDSDPSPTSSHSSAHGVKRKLDFEDTHYILQDPELYGLRRSGRAHQNRQIIESDSDGDDSDVDTRPIRKRRKAEKSHRSSIRASPTRHSMSRSDSDANTIGKPRNRPLQKKQRQLAQAVVGLVPPPERFSTRRAAKIQSYNEDDDENEFVEDESEFTPSYWVGGGDDDSPYIEAVMNHRIRDNTVIDPKEIPRKQDYEFCVKWKDRAHYHATWESSSTLSTYRGYRRLENYFKKIIIGFFELDNDPQTTPEDREQWLLDRERDADALLEHMQVERIISRRDGETGTEYLVKWKGLFYESSTWESASLVSVLSQNEIDRYLDRQSNKTVSSKIEGNPRTRSAYVPFKEQPDFIKNGVLREFQILGVNFLAHNWCKGNNVILADEMGLGKTVQTIVFISWLRHVRNQHGPSLVIVPLSTMPAWAEAFNYWAPDTNYVVYHGNKESREMIREHEFFVDASQSKVKFHVLLTTYEYVLSDAEQLAGVSWQFLAVDEAHRLKNRDSVLYTKMMEFNASSRLLITGTPIQNDLNELSSLTDFLMPGKIKFESNIDLSSDAASEKLAELTAMVAPYMIRRTKKKVENDLPPKTERILRIELSDIQLELYKHFLTKNYAALNAGSKGPTLLNTMMELKKMCNHPFLFQFAEERILGDNPDRADYIRAMITSSGKMMLLDQLLKKLQTDGHRVLIFSQMVKMLDLISEYLTARGYQHQRLDGTIGAVPRRMAIDHFNEAESKDFCFLLSTRAGGLGINLMTADTVILFDSDWNPQADLQAMARAHRIGQKKPVIIYRFVSKDTVEEEVLERARNKLMLEWITIQRGVTDKDAKDLSDRFARGGRNVAEPTTSDEINRILKKRGQKMFEQTGNQKKLEELDIDAVLENAEEHQTEQPEALAADGGEEFLKSFEYTDVKMDLEWDEIIPKEQLERLKAEEERKRHEAFLREQVEMNAPRKRKALHDDHEQRAAKKRARDLAAEAADDDSSDSNADPKRPLVEKEIRNLIRAYERYGSFEDRGEELIKDAKLVGRDPEILHATLNEILDISREALRQEHERLEELGKNNQIVTKKDRKAILFDFKGVKRLNAETLIDRPGEMRMLKEFISKQDDFRSFRVDGAEKKANYTCEWGAREDGMLCVGIARHGFGAWVAIREDPDLGLGNKFYLEEHRVANSKQREEEAASGKKRDEDTGNDKKLNVKSPGAVHLVRRANYLITCLKDKTSNGTNIAAKNALENHHRNNRKSQSRKPEKSSQKSNVTDQANRRSQGARSESESTHPDSRQGIRDSHSHQRKASGKELVRVERNNGDDYHPKNASQALRKGKIYSEQRLSNKNEKYNRSERGEKHHENHISTHSSSKPPASNGEAARRKNTTGEGDKANSHGQTDIDPKARNFLRPISESLASLHVAFKLTDKVEKLARMKKSIMEIMTFLEDNPPEAQSAEFKTACWHYIGVCLRRDPEILKALFKRISQLPAAPSTTPKPVPIINGTSGAALEANGSTLQVLPKP